MTIFHEKLSDKSNDEMSTLAFGSIPASSLPTPALASSSLSGVFEVLTTEASYIIPELAAEKPLGWRLTRLDNNNCLATPECPTSPAC